MRPYRVFARGWVAFMQRLRTFMEQIGRELAVYRGVLSDSRTPLAAKVLLAAAIGYFVLPIDLIPDVIPVLGQLDDLLIVPGLVWLALRLVPHEVVDEWRAKVAAEAGPPPRN
jgi:uncharacterized membrane protein YkvA (DUF1232 family)